MTIRYTDPALRAVQAALLPPLTTLCALMEAHHLQGHVRVPLTYAGMEGASAPTLFVPHNPGHTQHERLRTHAQAQPIETALHTAAQEIHALMDGLFAHTLPDAVLETTSRDNLVFLSFLNDGVFYPHALTTPAHMAAVLARAQRIIVRDDCPRSLPPLSIFSHKGNPTLCPGRNAHDQQRVYTRLLRGFSKARKATKASVEAARRASREA